MFGEELTLIGEDGEWTDEEGWEDEELETAYVEAGPQVRAIPGGGVYIFRRDFRWLWANDRGLLGILIGLGVLATMVVNLFTTQRLVFLVIGGGLIWGVLLVSLVLRIYYWRENFIRIDAEAGTIEHQFRPRWWEPLTEPDSLSPRAGRELRSFEVTRSFTWGLLGIGRLYGNMAGKDVDLNGVRHPQLIRNFIYEWVDRAGRERLDELYHQWQTEPSPAGNFFRAVGRFLRGPVWTLLRLPFLDLRGALEASKWLQEEGTSPRLVFRALYHLSLPVGWVGAMVWAAIQADREPLLRWGPLVLIIAVYFVRALLHTEQPQVVERQRHLVEEEFDEQPDLPEEEEVLEPVPRRPALELKVATIKKIPPWNDRRTFICCDFPGCGRKLIGAIQQREYPGLVFNCGGWQSRELFFHSAGEQMKVYTWAKQLDPRLLRIPQVTFPAELREELER